MKDKLRKLVQITKILDIKPHTNADMLELATIFGWQVVVRKGEFNIGDDVVYFAIDSFLPIEEKYEFLRSSCYRNNNVVGEGFRIKTIKLRGEISQGLILPLKMFDKSIQNLEPETDISENLNVKKYETHVDSGLGHFHSTISKTDELRVQEDPGLIEALKQYTLNGGKYYISEKIDGQSMTIVIEPSNYDTNKFSLKLYSRNFEILYDENEMHWKWMINHKLDDALIKFYLTYKQPLFLQGEFYGEGVQTNKLKIKGKDFKIFNIGDPLTGEYYDFDDWGKILNAPFNTNMTIGKSGVDISSSKLKDFVDTVKILPNPREIFDFTLPELIELAKGKYDSGKHREGIVIRPTRELLYKQQRLSFKVINNDFLIKYDE